MCKPRVELSRGSSQLVLLHLHETGPDVGERFQQIAAHLLQIRIGVPGGGKAGATGLFNPGPLHHQGLRHTQNHVLAVLEPFGGVELLLIPLLKRPAHSRTPSARRKNTPRPHCRSTFSNRSNSDTGCARPCGRGRSGWYGTGPAQPSCSSFERSQ